MQQNEVVKGFKMTALGPVPVEWQEATLGEIADPKYGRAKPRTHGRIPVVGSGGVYGWTDKALVDFPTIILGRKGAAGEVWLADNPCWPADTTFYLAWKREVDVIYVLYFLKLHKPSGEHARTTLPSLQRHEVERLCVPLPPLQEQQAIASVLSTIQRAIEAQDKVIAATRELKKSLMRYLFTYGPVPVDQASQVSLKDTEIGPVPEQWQVVRLGELCDSPQYGYTSPAVQSPVGPRMVRITDIQDGRVNWSSVPHCRCGAEDAVKYALHPGDILFARTGSVGKAFLVAQTPGSAVFASYLIRIHLPSHVDAQYVHLFMQSPGYWDQIAAHRHGAVQPNMNATQLRALLVPLPSLAEQQKIAGTLQAVDAKIAAEERRKSALQALFQTALHHLMTGKVRVPVCAP
jgi:type I restriction enzyme S subunit